MRATLLTLCLSLLLAGCSRGTPPAPRASSLAGVSLPLMPSSALRLVVPGVLSGRRVAVSLDVSRPLSTAATACLGDGDAPPNPEGTARVPEASGGVHQWTLVPMGPLSLGEVTLPPRRVGLTTGRACEVTLGLDVLAPYALTVEPLRREVSFAPSRPREAYAAEVAAARADAATEVALVELSREPSGDWPLLAARVTQGEARLTGPFVLTSREASTRLALGPAQAQGLAPRPAKEGGKPGAFWVDTVEVTQGVGVGPLAVEAGAWASAGSLGRLGPDVWGRFQATLDSKAGVMVLRRPRVLTPEGGRPRCARPGGQGEGEEACYALHVRRESEEGLLLTAAVLRDLPEGGRLHLEPLGAQGERLESPCRVGFSFGPTGRGVTTQHRFPWHSLALSLTECHAALGAARGYALSLFEEGPHPACPGTCAFVQHARRARTVCECQPSPGGQGGARGQGKREPSQPPPPEEREREPEDPK